MNKPERDLHNIAVIDTKIDDYQMLVEAAEAMQMEVLIISGDQGLKELAEQLEYHTGIDSLRIFSHGSQGALHLGKDVLTSKTLGEHTEALSIIKGSLSGEGDILIYGCNVAEGEQGQAFIEELALATGADIAASDDLTGAQNKGGDWELEFTLGKTESLAPFKDQVSVKFTSLLVATDGTKNFSSWAGSGSNTLTTTDFSLSANGGFGPVDLELAGMQAYMGSSQQGASDAYFHIQADGTNTGSFELSGLQLSEFAPNTDMTNVFIVGNLLGGGTVTSATINGTPALPENFVFDNSKLGSFSGAQLTGFKVFFDLPNINNSYLNNVNFDSFSIVNGQAPSFNTAPTFDQDGDNNGVLSDDEAGGSVNLTIAEDSGALDLRDFLQADDPDTAQTLTWSVTASAPATGGAIAITSGTVNTPATDDQPFNATYTPLTDFNGTDTFSIDVSDGTDTDTLQITVTVTDAPDITSVDVANGTYGLGDEVTVSVTFDEAVTVISGTPTIDINVGGNTRTVNLDSGDGTTTLSGTYTIQAGDDDANGIDIGLNAITGNIEDNDGDGNSADLSNSSVNDGGETVDATAPTITGVSIPDAPARVGDAVTVSITASEAGLSLDTGTVNGIAVTGFTDNGGGTYSATYTVQEGDTDRAAGEAIPVNFVLSDAAGNTSDAFTTAISQASDAIDANTPSVLAVSVPNTTMKVGDAVTVTLTASEAGLSLETGTINGVAITGFTDNGNGTYSATYTVQEGDTDRAAGEDIPVNVALSDATGNTSANFTTPISQDGDAIDASTPSILAVSIPNATMKVGDAVTVIITANEAGLTLETGTINGVAVTGFSDNGAGTYNATYTVQEGDTDRAAGEDIPVNFVLSDAAGNTSDAFNTAISQGSDAIDANSPGTPTATLEISENSTNASAVGTVTGGGTDGVTYSLTDDANGRFAIDAARNVTVADGSQLNYETNTTHSITVRATDDAGNTTDNILSVAVNNINEAPAIDLNSSDAPGTSNYSTNFSAGGVAVGIANTDASLADEDAGAQISSLNVTLVNQPDGADEILSLDTTAAAAATGSGLMVVYDAGTGTLTAAGSAAPSTYQTILQGILYENTSAPLNITTGDRTLEVVANDGTLNSATTTSTISVVTAPVTDLAGNGDGDLTENYTEGDGPIAVAGAATLAEPDGDNLNQLSIQLTNALDGANESITLHGRSTGDTVNGVTITYNSATSITLSGSATASEYQALLRELEYENSSDDPNTTNRAITVQGTDVNGNAGAPATLTIDLTPVNDAPELLAAPTNPGYTEGDPSTGALFNVTNSDTIEAGQTFNALTLTVSNLFDGGNEALIIDGTELALTDGNTVSTTNGLTVSSSVTGPTATITLSGAALTETELNTLITELAYRNTSDNPTTGTGTDRITTLTSVTDSGGTTNGGTESTALSISSIVDLTPVNDAPTIAVNDGPSVRTGNTVTLTTANLNEGDPDDDGGALTYTLDTFPTTGTLSLSATALEMGDTFTQQDINDGLVTFRAGTTAGEVSFDVTLADGGEDGASSISDTVTITVTPPPPPPTPTPTPTPDTEQIDGVDVTQDQEQTENGDTVDTIVIQPVPDNRNDTDPTSSDADIPLHFAGTNGTQPVTILTLPTGVGASARTNNTASTRTTEQELLSLIRNSAGSETDDLASQLEGGGRFLGQAGNGNLWVNRITLQREPGSDANAPIRINGQAPGTSSDFREAMVIDGRGLGGGRLELNNIEFAVVVGGGLNLSGGAGNNTVFAGAGSQTLILGEGDDELHGGAGDDVVGSKGGNDRLFGNSGNDTLFGGTGNNLLHGGRDQDVITIDGNRDDYIVTQLHSVITVQRNDGNNIDTIINAEALAFEDETVDITYSTGLNWITTLYDSLLNRQADLDGVQYWADQLERTDNFIDIVWGFLNSAEFTQTLGQPIGQLDEGAQVDLLYQTLLNRQAETEGRNYWVNTLETGVALEDVAAAIAHSEEASANHLSQGDWEFLL